MRWAKRTFHARPRGESMTPGGGWFSGQRKVRKSSVTGSSGHVVLRVFRTTVGSDLCRE